MQRKPEDTGAEGHPYDNISLDALGIHQFFGEVDTDKAVAACEFILKSNIIHRELSSVTLVLNTVGGECNEAFAIIDMMDTSRIPIATVGVGNIMSMGVLLLSAGAKGLRTMTKNTEVMAHQFSGYFGGKQHELIAVQQSITLLEAKFIRHFTTHSKMSEKQVRDILFAPSDRYLTPAECLKFGLVDRVVDYALSGLPLSMVHRPKVKAPRSRSSVRK